MDYEKKLLSSKPLAMLIAPPPAPPPTTVPAGLEGRNSPVNGWKLSKKSRKANPRFLHTWPTPFLAMPC